MSQKMIGQVVGASAYKTAVTHGFSGTEQQWLASLKGEIGETPVFTVGDVETLPHGSDATVTITGTPENPIINIGIPEGDFATITVGTVEAVSPDSSLEITNSGTERDAILNFKIPMTRPDYATDSELNTGTQSVLEKKSVTAWQFKNEIDDIDGYLTQIESAKVNKSGDTITGVLTVNNEMYVRGGTSDESVGYHIQDSNGNILAMIDVVAKGLRLINFVDGGTHTVFLSSTGSFTVPNLTATTTNVTGQAIHYNSISSYYRANTPHGWNDNNIYLDSAGQAGIVGIGFQSHYHVGCALQAGPDTNSGLAVVGTRDPSSSAITNFGNFTCKDVRANGCVTATTEYIQDSYILYRRGTQAQYDADPQKHLILHYDVVG